MKNLKYIILISFTLMTCNTKKDETKKLEQTMPVKSVVKDDVFNVSLEVKVSEDDKFQFFYKDVSPDEKYDVNKRIVVNIKGSEDKQTVTFNLPKDVLPYMFRIDLGEKGYETPIEISSIKVKMNTNEIFIDSTTINRFFSSNIFLETKNGFKFERKKVANRYDPILTSTPFLIKKIEMEF